MHDGCSASFTNGNQVLQKIRSMGFAHMSIPIPLEILCSECGEIFTMFTMESACPACNMSYAVTPCHATRPENVLAAGIGA